MDNPPAVAAAAKNVGNPQALAVAAAKPPAVAAAKNVANPPVAAAANNVAYPPAASGYSLHVVVTAPPARVVVTAPPAQVVVAPAANVVANPPARGAAVDVLMTVLLFGATIVWLGLLIWFLM